MDNFGASAVYGELHNNLRSLVATFYAWYAFFWTLNIAALAWMYVKQKDLDRIVHRNRRYLALLFVVLNLMSVFCTVGLIVAASKLIGGIAEVGAMIPDNQRLSSVASAAAGPGWVYYFSLGVSGTATALIALFWCAMYRSDTKAS